MRISQNFQVPSNKIDQDFPEKCVGALVLLCKAQQKDADQFASCHVHILSSKFALWGENLDKVALWFIFKKLRRNKSPKEMEICVKY